MNIFLISLITVNLEISMSDICQKVAIGIFWSVIMLVANPMMLGVVHFEKYGADPMKRNLIDMVKKLNVTQQCRPL